jgi:Na+-driven multidrug efflux pump
MALINIFLDYVLIFGKMGFPEMGIRGAAAASVLAEMAVTAFFVFYTLSLTDLKKYNLFTFTGFNFELWIRLAGISLPVMIQNFISLAVWFVFFIFVEKMGETQLAISNIIRSVYVILMIPIQGFSSATNTLVSFLIGQGRLSGVLPVIYKTSWLCFLMVMVFVVFSLLMPSEIIGIYTDDPLLAKGSVPVLYVVSGSVICFAFAMVFLYGVSGTGKTQVALIMELAVITVYLIAAYLFANVLSFPIALVWTVEFIYAILLFLLSFLYLRFGNWRKPSRRI